MDDQPRAGQKRILAYAKLLVLLVLLIGLPLLLFLRYPEFVSLLKEKDLLDAFLMEHRAESGWILLGVQILQVVISFLPGQVAQFCSGYVLGIFPGFVICIAGCAIGTVISYVLARLFGRDAVELFFGKERTARYMASCQSPRAFRILFLLYLIPMLPKDLLAYVAGAAGFPLRKLLLLSLIGRTPAMLLGIAMGERLASESYLGLLALCCIALLLIVLCLWKRKAVETFLERLSKV